MKLPAIAATATLLTVALCPAPACDVDLPAADSPAATTRPDGTPTPPPVVLSKEAMVIHRSAIVFDGHNDLPIRMRGRGKSSFDQIDIAKPQPDFHTDIDRLNKGGLGAQFWSAYVPCSTMAEGGAARYALEQIDLIKRMVTRYPDTFAMAYTAEDVIKARQQGKIASLIGIEGGHAIEDSLATLRMFHELGVRYMTLTHADTLSWCDSATDEHRHGGLTAFGENVILEMNRLGMLVDISHVSADAMRDVLRVSKAPVIASHSSAYTIAEHPRNVPDDVLKIVAKNRGVVMVNFYSAFVEPTAAQRSSNVFNVRRELKEKHPDEHAYRQAWQKWKNDNPLPRGTIHTVVDHIEHIIKVAGIDHVGLGSDYDGVNILPKQLEDVASYPYITQALLDRGYAAGDIRKILGGNALRALREAETVAIELRKSSEPILK